MSTVVVKAATVTVTHRLRLPLPGSSGSAVLTRFSRLSNRDTGEDSVETFYEPRARRQQQRRGKGRQNTP